MIVVRVARLLELKIRTVNLRSIERGSVTRSEVSAFLMLKPQEQDGPVPTTMACAAELGMYDSFYSVKLRRCYYITSINTNLRPVCKISV